MVCAGWSGVWKFVQILYNTTNECFIHWNSVEPICIYTAQIELLCQLHTACDLTYRQIWNLHTASGAEKKTLLQTEKEKEVSLLCVYLLMLCSVSERKRKQQLSRILAVRITAAQTAPLHHFKDPPDRTSCHVNPRWNKYSNVLPDSNKNSHVYGDKKGCSI